MLVHNSKKHEFIHTEPIPITSPEQFVPLFLAQHSPLVYEAPVLDDFTNPITKREMKQWLIDQYNHPYPSNYSLCIKKEDITSTRTYSESCYNLFCGEEPNWGKSNTCISKLGFIARKNIKIFNSSNSSLYRSIEIFSFTNVLLNITPLVLVLVKARFIPYLRIRLSLGLPIELPLNSFLILKQVGHNSLSSDSKNTYTRVSLLLDKLIITQHPIVKYVSTKEMLSYLVKFTYKTKEQYLNDAITATINPEMVEEINV